MLSFGPFGKSELLINIEPIVGFGIGIHFYLESNAAIIELGFVRVILDWPSDETSGT